MHTRIRASGIIDVKVRAANSGKYDNFGAQLGHYIVTLGREGVVKVFEPVLGAFVF